MSISEGSPRLSTLELVAFDLDGTIWSPDMYQLWGGGAPFHQAPNGRDLLDCKGNCVHMLGISAQVLDWLKTAPSMANIKVAWVSCTDEPDWARECLQKFRTVPGGIPIERIADSVQIFKSNKQTHFQNLKKLYSDIEYSEMLFFDNEMGNIRNVSKLGVKCVYCPDGITQKAWQEGMDLFSVSN